MTYKKRVVPFDQKKTDNFAVLLFFAVFLIFGVINIADKRTPLLVTGSVWFDSLIALGVFAVGVPAHEGLHALSAMLFGKAKRKDIKIGFDIRNGNLYTHFSEPIMAKAYAVALIVPAIVTGVVPIAIVTAFGGPIVLAPACLLLAACAGDLVMFFSVVKLTPDVLISDHPAALAYYVVYPEGLEPEGFSELTPEEEEMALKRSVTVGPRDEKARKKSMLLKCLGILAFLALYVLAMYLISLFMKLI